MLHDIKTHLESAVTDRQTERQTDISFLVLKIDVHEKISSEISAILKLVQRSAQNPTSYLVKTHQTIDYFLHTK